MATVLTETGEFDVPAAPGLSLAPEDAERVTGWTLKPEGMCRDDICVPWKAAEGRVDVAEFWRHLGHPVLSDASGETWVLGTGAEQRKTALAGLEAPDFTLPDLAGVPHSLAELRGRKILLTTWASW